MSSFYEYRKILKFYASIYLAIKRKGGAIVIETNTKDMNVLKDARLASKLTQAEIAKSFGCSTPTVTNQEKRPDKLALEDLSKWYNVVSDDAKLWIKEFVDSFFIVENAKK